MTSEVQRRACIAAGTFYFGAAPGVELYYNLLFVNGIFIMASDVIPNAILLCRLVCDKKVRVLKLGQDFWL